MTRAEQNTRVKTILAAIRSLPEEDLKYIVSNLLDYGQVVSSSIASFVEENKYADGLVCPYCGKKHVRRNGHRKDGTQKYVCAECGRHFVARTNTITSGSRKPLETWKKYIDCMVNGLPIRRTAEECDMADSTSFAWRHKILDALRNMGDDVTLSGITESDDTYFPLSYKGNHAKSKGFDMGRPPRKRGGDGISKGLTDDLVCVPCAVDRKGNSVAEVSNIGQCTANDLGNVLGTKIAHGATFCTDGSKAQRKFAMSRKLECVQIKGGKAKKGIFHIQHINNYHSVLKKFIERFNGVSTKYLNNYLAWNNFVKYSKKNGTPAKPCVYSQR